MDMKRFKAAASTKALWSLICAMMIGGITHSISASLLFGVIGFVYGYSDFFHVASGVAVDRHHIQSCCEGNDIVNTDSHTDTLPSMPEDYYLATLNSELDFTIAK